jgi:hypothetical protein
MEERPSVVERAFQIAKSGAVANMAELSAQLTAEDYTNNEHPWQAAPWPSRSRA